jgi:hypothetical protein
MPTNLQNPAYPFDPSGSLASNLVTGEQQILSPANSFDFNFLVPIFAPFFQESLVVNFTDINNNSRQLVEGIDFYCTHWFISASRACAKAVYGSICMLNRQLTGVIVLRYQTLGGIWLIDQAQIATILSDHLRNPRITAWEEVTDLPMTFPPIDHEWNLADMVGMSDVVTSLNNIEAAVRQTLIDGLAAHEIAINPHNVTAAQVSAYTIDQVNQLLANYYTKANIDSMLAGYAATSSTNALEDELYFTAGSQ